MSTTLIPTDDGRVLFYGCDPYDISQGSSDDTMRYRPGYLKNLTNIKQIIGCPSNYTALDAEGRLKSSQTEIETQLASKRFTLIVGGGALSMALDSDGQVYDWLLSDSNITTYQVLTITSVASRVNVMLLNDRGEALIPGYRHEFRRIEFPGKVIKIACNMDQYLAVTQDGRVWSSRHCDLRLTEITLVRDLVSIVDVFCGDYYSMALNQQGQLYSWGQNYHGELGLGDKKPRETPELVSTLKDVVITKLFCEYSHCVAIDTDGGYWGWGNNYWNQLNLNNQEYLIPTQFGLKPIKRPMSAKIAEAACRCERRQNEKPRLNRYY
jgi:alpha-tubulin suppressor-like RCC1 family protein